MIDKKILRDIQLLVGREWSPEYNCYHVARDVIRLFGYELPLTFNVDLDSELSKHRVFTDHPERNNWRVIDQPNTWAAVLMNKRGHTPIIHCGVWLEVDRGVVIHSDRDHDTVIENLQQLTLRGWELTFLEP